MPVSMPPDPSAKQVVEPGTIGFWVEGSCLAIPFGPTPISQHGECRLAAKVTVLGSVLGDPRVLKLVKAGEKLEITPELLRNN